MPPVTCRTCPLSTHALLCFLNNASLTLSLPIPQPSPLQANASRAAVGSVRRTPGAAKPAPREDDTLRAVRGGDAARNPPPPVPLTRPPTLPYAVATPH